MKHDHNKGENMHRRKRTLQSIMWNQNWTFLQPGEATAEMNIREHLFSIPISLPPNPSQDQQKTKEEQRKTKQRR